MLLKRREFLKTGSLASAAWFIPRFLKAVEATGAWSAAGKKLVMIQLSGGNDGLNTVVPVRNDIYYRERPGLAIQRQAGLALNDEAALHPALTAMKGLWDDGAMAILNSVGYPNPDRSHFRSMDIWHTASPAAEYWSTGWLGRYLDAQCPGKPSAALEFDDTLSLVMKGEQTKGLALQDAKRLYQSTRSPYFNAYSSAWTNRQADISDPHWARDASAGAPEISQSPLDYLYKTMGETLSSAEYLFEQSRLKPTQANYPTTSLGKDLRTIASLILADTDTSVYYVSLGSFDTHIRQEGQQKRLFEELNGALGAFAADMKANGKWEEVLVVTFSEFGRRVAQNASGGTDHGTANNMLFFSGSLKQKGLLNPLPDLLQLDAGDLRYEVDFRQVYATLLQKWLDAPAQTVLKARYNPLDFV